jgi:hypothetical protein
MIVEFQIMEIRKLLEQYYNMKGTKVRRKATPEEVARIHGLA